MSSQRFVRWRPGQTVISASEMNRPLEALEGILGGMDQGEDAFFGDPSGFFVGEKRKRPGARLFKTPDTGIPPAKNDYTPGMVECERWRRNPQNNQFEREGTMELVYTRSKTEVPGNYLITAVDNDGEWEMAILICNAAEVSSTQGTSYNSLGADPGAASSGGDGFHSIIINGPPPNRPIPDRAGGNPASGSTAGMRAGVGLGSASASARP